jgi:hypothetical protein
MWCNISQVNLKHGLVGFGFGGWVCNAASGYKTVLQYGPDKVAQEWGAISVSGIVMDNWSLIIEQNRVLQMKATSYLSAGNENVLHACMLKTQQALSQHGATRLYWKLLAHTLGCMTLNIRPKERDTKTHSN